MAELLDFLNKARNGGVKKSSQQLVYGALDRYKINLDGVVFALQKSVGIGVLIRDSEGRLAGACSKKIQAPLGAVEEEAKAVEFGLHFVKDMMIQDFILKGDSLAFMNALKEISPPPSSVAAVVYGSLSTSHGFCQEEFFHVHQQSNRPAYLLAKHALGIRDFSVWIE
ncbi:uncharacterized protein LOC142632436 [Castanea sativa]|uniref:uncharacterized protein LOC142632436 n=1 Tax=Castanea sativa TaxID=21020 RepID=UPI003F652CFD